MARAVKSEWPLCGNSMTLVGDWRLECVLPRGHLLDGEQYHENADGTQWVTTLTRDDGTEERR